MDSFFCNDHFCSQKNRPSSSLTCRNLENFFENLFFLLPTSPSFPENGYFRFPRFSVSLPHHSNILMYFVTIAHDCTRLAARLYHAFGPRLAGPQCHVEKSFLNLFFVTENFFRCINVQFVVPFKP